MAIKAWKQGRSKEDDYIVEGLSGQQKVKLSTEWRTAVSMAPNRSTKKQNNTQKNKTKQNKKTEWPPG